MDLNEQIPEDFHDKYNEAVNLTKTCIGDNVSTCKVQKIVDEMLTKITELLTENRYKPESLEHIKLTAMKGALCLILEGLEGDEVAIGNDILTEYYGSMKPYELKAEMIIVSVSVYNNLGIKLAKRDLKQSKSYFEKAEELYCTFTKLGEKPLDLPELFQKVNQETDGLKAEKHLENCNLLTMFYLAQYYEKTEDKYKSSHYLHKILKKQQEIDDYEPIEWVLNAVSLSQFFLEKLGFKQARHHLAAATLVLEQHKSLLEDEAQQESYKHRSADLARCWTKYAINILSSSKERLLKHTEDIDSKCTLSTDLRELNLTEDERNVYFTKLDLSFIEQQITDKFCLDLSDARKVFLIGQSWVKQAQEYYTLNSHASDFIEITQDHSLLYSLLVFFEGNYENQAKLHKRRIDLLEAVLKEINPKYYLKYCQELWFELGQAYRSLLDIKKDKISETQGRAKPEAIQKVNTLTEKSIKHYESFKESLRSGPENKLPDRVAEHLEHSFLNCCFMIACLYGNFLLQDPQTDLKNKEASYKMYKFICDYVKRNPAAKPLIAIELQLCEEMVKFLPVKLQLLRSQQ